MTKLNIIEFTDKSNLIPKLPYQVDDWEVTSIKSEPTHLWKYFHKNDIQSLYGDGEYILFSDISLRKEEIENILKDRKEEFVITQKFKLSIFGRIFTKIDSS